METMEDNMEENMGYVIRVGNSKKDSNRNARNQIHCNRNKECLNDLISQLEPG